MPTAVVPTQSKERFWFVIFVAAVLVALFLCTRALFYVGANIWVALFLVPALLAALAVMYRWDQLRRLQEEREQEKAEEEAFFEHEAIHFVFGVDFLYAGGWALYASSAASAGIGLALLIGGLLLFYFGLKLLKNFV